MELLTIFVGCWSNMGLELFPYRARRTIDWQTALNGVLYYEFDCAEVFLLDEAMSSIAKKLPGQGEMLRFGCQSPVFGD